MIGMPIESEGKPKNPFAPNIRREYPSSIPLGILRVVFVFAFSNSNSALCQEAEIEFFEKKIRPVLVERCCKCQTAMENKVHMHDLHATILHLLGIDHEKLVYRYTGRDFGLTDVYGKVIREIIV